jgi:hypothetical protein
VSALFGKLSLVGLFHTFDLTRVFCANVNGSVNLVVNISLNGVNKNRGELG